MAGIIDKLMKQVNKEMDARISILAPKIEESNNLLKQILAELQKR
ncbi:hypothetical protein ES703_14353 [subsurface metagenome]